jgi:hypothetical protein
MLGLLLAPLFLFGATLGSASNSDPAQQGIDGVWSGESTNGMFGTLLSIQLTTNGYGAVYGGGGYMGAPGTFTYSLFHGQIRFVTNDTPFLTGTFRYDATNDIIAYRRSAKAAKALRESSEPLLLRRDTNEMHRAMLGSMIGATNYNDLMTRLGHFLDSVTNHPEWFQTNSAAHKSAQPKGLSR